MRRPDSGLSLIELLVVLAIAGLVAAIALPNYASAVAKSRRTAAAACLSEHALALERAYPAALAYPAVAPTLACASELAGHYTVSASLQAQTFTLIATPSANQAAKDSGCGCALSLSSNGAKGVGGACTVAACW